MMLTLQRLTKSKDIPTFGVLFFETGIPFALTLERAWRNNEKGISCIPGDEFYDCHRINSDKFGDTFEVTGVKGRDEILFHKGNIEDDSHGCILVGEQFEILNTTPAIVASKHGFDEFLSITKDLNFFVLHIKEPPNA